MSIFFIIWIFSIIICSIMGYQKGELLYGFVGALLLGPLWIIGVAVTQSAKLKCPHCAEPISREAVICPHCRLETKFNGK